MIPPSKRRRNAVAAAAVVAVLSSLAAWGGSAPAQAADTHVVTDMSGAKVRVPDTVTRIAEQFPAHTATDIMLGVGRDLVAIPQNVSTIPFLRAVDPSITKVPQLFPSDGSVNMEQLLAQKPDVVSITGTTPSAKSFEAVGLPAVDLTFTTFSGLVQSVRLAGQVYGGVAQTRATAYVDYLNSTLKMIQSRVAKVPASQRPSVVHISSYPPLVIDGNDSIIDEWIKMAGGTDAAGSVHGSHVSVNMEQLLKWNPDVLIIETPGGDQGLTANSAKSVLASLAKAPGWDDLKAVKDGRVYFNPQGLYPWDRFGPEEALQVQWAAKVLQPKVFKDLNMRAVTRSFYQKFFDYTPSNAQLNQILQTTSSSGIATATAAP
jgi:iron complex transport system substrate-binding protein